jgi:hypothetical protein
LSKAAATSLVAATGRGGNFPALAAVFSGDFGWRVTVPLVTATTSACGAGPAPNRKKAWFHPPAACQLPDPTRGGASRITTCQGSATTVPGCSTAVPNATFEASPSGHGASELALPLQTLWPHDGLFLQQHSCLVAAGHSTRQPWALRVPLVQHAGPDAKATAGGAVTESNDVYTASRALLACGPATDRRLRCVRAHRRGQRPQTCETMIAGVRKRGSRPGGAPAGGSRRRHFVFNHFLSYGTISIGRHTGRTPRMARSAAFRHCTPPDHLGPVKRGLLPAGHPQPVLHFPRRT